MRKLIKKNKVTVFFTIVLLVLCGLLLFKMKNIRGTKQTVKELKSIKEYGYKLYDNETKLGIKKFEELAKLLEKENFSEEEYAKLVAELFVIDFYTLDNKLTNKHIGGLQYVDPDIKENLIEKATDTYYKGIENKLVGKRKQKLPIVKSIKTDEIKQAAVSTDPLGYLVKVSWDYEKGDGFQKQATISLVHQDKKLYLYKIDK